MNSEMFVPRRFENDTSARVRSSVQSILANQNEDGAFIASPDFAQYHYCWLRDGSFTAYALDCAGEHEASARFHDWVCRALEGIGESIDQAVSKLQRGELVDPLHMPPARFALDFSTEHDDWPNFQIDGYGTWLWAFGKHLELTGQDAVPDEFRETVERVGEYISTFCFSPCYDVWEESGSAIHTSTLASIYGGLKVAARLLGGGDLATRALEIQSRLRDSAARLGRFVKSTECDDVDSSILWLVMPFAVFESDDDYFAKTVRVIETELTFANGLRRYPTDVYFGSGAWPILTASLGWNLLSQGDVDGAERALNWISDRFDERGRLGEQFDGELRDPEHYHQWVERWGIPAQDLTWSHAMFVVLALALERFNASGVDEAIF